MVNLGETPDATPPSIRPRAAVVVLPRRRVPIGRRLAAALDRLDGAVIWGLGVLVRACVDGFAAYGAAYHGYVPSAHTGRRPLSSSVGEAVPAQDGRRPHLMLVAGGDEAAKAPAPAKAPPPVLGAIPPARLPARH